MGKFWNWLEYNYAKWRKTVQETGKLREGKGYPDRDRPVKDKPAPRGEDDIKIGPG
jgi:hypothetical protein